MFQLLPNYIITFPIIWSANNWDPRPIDTMTANPAVADRAIITKTTIEWTPQASKIMSQPIT